MKAIHTSPPGGWDQTRLVETDEPMPQSGEALVEIHATGLNPADRFLIEGSYPGGPKPPFVAGRDAAGVVLRDDSGRWKSGDRVVVLQASTTNLADGTLAQRQRIQSDLLAPLPDKWSFTEGATALTYLTAWQALMHVRPISQGEVVLITGASGGVGTAAVQLAVGLGAKVVALSRSESKRQRLLGNGAHFALDPQREDLKKEVFRDVERQGVDLVVENVGGDSLATAVHLLGKGGAVAVVGLLAGVEGRISIPSLLFKRARVEGVLVTDDSVRHAQSNWEQIASALDTTGQRPLVDRTFPLGEYQSAFEHLSASPFGKVIVLPQEG
ncbi:Phthiocerol synthesis polyketide synthase type I PpsC [Planctomycetes bacterium Pan216]|uniref:Phthiocerol synthesis polyketide synthase type I PpsC n=1 Tax=Kolteria novifilia TaxID=2527975 RepID=A0A518BC70_9BACT|nr:Phthiocerol synthesis polyketide synthase type I PpsC [Planctomycetes bacterium Pan216]